MTRPNLTIERIAITLAALGTSAVIGACTKAAEPASVRADQPVVNANASASASPPPPPVATATAADTKPDDPKKMGEPTVSGSAKPILRSPMPGGTSGQASCGAGSCTANMKKK